MKKVLTIAGSDSGGGAGIQADLKTMTAHGVYGASVITAVTAQNTLGVQAVETLNKDFVAAQLDSVLSDIDFDALKTGMLATKELVEITAQKIEEYELKNLVVDPVMVATSGDLLLAENAVESYKELLFPLADLITPNLMEAKVLAGIDKEAEVEAEFLAKKLHSFGSKYVLIKGGHFSNTVQQSKKAVDLLYDGSSFVKFEADYIETNDTHGTGCTLSAAIASNLALGYSMEKAVEKAKIYLTKAIAEGEKIGMGNSPLNHIYQLDLKRESIRG
ncbi:bifunctional hydroxymethylpyrimidine kinase/phosphomethylpyrimidine kinase [Halanaerobium hydrogeniformans]|uniref:Hydroxymethylpyrimidine/phosphomethylpyrimidine kinase n=1 Tax=Halanaerobium hydrogeniformans TaxID=656519 RepID=E4RMU8_HALHG|nr:bifunctional hydroxymethylpyrimidine kinase/phosphomethylpyrimidine kinase [Halanaerobium hydrogeniformans]ADQ14165.1 phosphomethylpyrimidine kinase [Halanaerobium hydrogeniformans]